MPRPHNTIDGIGDVVLAGYPTPYPHLRPTATRPSAGTLFATARHTGDLARLSPPPATGEWLAGSAPATVRAGGVSVTVAALPPTDVVVVPAGVAPAEADAGRGATVPAPEALLYAAQGEVHMVEISAAGHLRNVRTLTAGSGLVWSGRRHHQVVNTGSVPALLVHARSLSP